MADLNTKQDYLNEIEKWNLDVSIKMPTIKWTKPDIVSFYEQYKPRDDNVKVVIPLEATLEKMMEEQSTPFKETDLVVRETGITEIKANVGEEIATATCTEEGCILNKASCKECKKKMCYQFQLTMIDFAMWHVYFHF